MRTNAKQSISKVIPRREQSLDRAVDAMTMTKKADRPDRPATVAEIVAGSKIYIRNWKFDGAREMFPQNPELRHVEKYFPYAKMGPLLVDEPINPFEVAQCQKKSVALGKLGYLYLILTPEMDEFSARAFLNGAN